MRKLLRGPIFWIAIAVLFVLIGSSFISGIGAPEQIDTSVAIADIQANKVDTATIVDRDQVLELTLTDVWVWDVYRADRFVKSVKILTFKDINVEETGKKELKLPRDLAIGDAAQRRGDAGLVGGKTKGQSSRHRRGQ